MGLVVCAAALLHVAVGAQQDVQERLGAAVNAPELVKAGETVSFTITLDKPPNFKGSLQYWITPPIGGTITSSVDLEPGKKIYKVEFGVPIGAPGGTWALSELKASAGFDSVPVKFKPVLFQVVPNRDLIFPTSAEAKITPSQAQLLRREAFSLQGRIQILKSNLSKMPQAPQLADVLRRSLTDGLEAVQRTERSFTGFGGTESALEASRVFFADLQKSYLQALEDLPGGRLIATGARMLVTSFQNQHRYPAVAQGPLRVLEQNELAYSLVANKGDLTFDLEVNSAPQGATVFYWRRGDSERKNNKPTNSILPALPYAIWLVRLEIPGYGAEEREHDPFREPNHVVTVEMHKK